MRAPALDTRVEPHLLASLLPRDLPKVRLEPLPVTSRPGALGGHEIVDVEVAAVREARQHPEAGDRLTAPIREQRRQPVAALRVPLPEQPLELRGGTGGSKLAYDSERFRELGPAGRELTDLDAVLVRRAHRGYRDSGLPRLEDYSFGRVVADGEEQTRDLIVLPDRVVPNWWRRDGHSLAIDDLEDVLDELPERLVVGCGAHGRLRPAPAVIEALERRGVEVEVLTTDEAVRRYNELDERRAAAALHLTC